MELWEKKEVREAELCQAFVKGRGKQKPRREQHPGGRYARFLLEQAWEDAGKEDAAPWLLAGFYHQALMVRLPSMTKGRSSAAISSSVHPRSFSAKADHPLLVL